MSIAAPRTETFAFTVEDLTQLPASSRKNHLPEWKLAQNNGDPSQWHDWFGQFKSAIDLAPLTDDVKLTYLETLVTGKAKAAIAEYVQGRSENFIVDVGAATGSSECLHGQTQHFPAIENA